MTKRTAKPSMSMRQEAALIAVQHLLKTGQLVHKPEEDMGYAPHGACFFNMLNWRDEKMDWSDPNEGPVHCGSVMCIGGAVEWMCGAQKYEGEAGMSEIAEHDSGLMELFYPGQTRNSPVHNCNWDTITPRQAAKAIKNYRTTGKPQWEHVLTKDQLHVKA